MLHRSTNMWQCVWLCCAACTLDSSPRFPGPDDEGRAEEWKPAGEGAAPPANAAGKAEPIEDATMPASAANPTRPTDNMASTDPMAQAPPAAGSGVAPMQAMSAAGSGGVANVQAGAGGSAGSAGAEPDDLGQRLIDAASGRSPELVMSVLFSMRASGQCFRDVRRCVETCLVIAQNCQPCADDAECAAAFKEVCGETLGTCRSP